MKKRIITCLILSLALISKVAESQSRAEAYDDLCKSSENIYRSHPEYRTKYIHCFYGLAYVYDCPGDLYWCDDRKVCDFPIICP